MTLNLLNRRIWIAGAALMIALSLVVRLSLINVTYAQSGSGESNNNANKSTPIKPPTKKPTSKKPVAKKPIPKKNPTGNSNATNAAAAERNRQAAANASPPNTIGSEKRNLTRVKWVETVDGSMITIFSDIALNDYSAYRGGDRFYVLIPDADVSFIVGGMRGRGFADVRAQKRGNDVLVSFRLLAGANARVKQEFNRLEILISVPALVAANATTKINNDTSVTPTGISEGKPFRNSKGIEMVWIPPGSFDMGSDNGNADEKPVHRVTIAHGFFMGKYEVTQAQWQAVMGANPSYFKGDDNLPVELVSWNDTQEFVNKLNEMNDGYKYRMPTEAEWEYACRAGTTGDYYSSEPDDIAWYSENSDQKTHKVGTKQANAFGLYDMSGNVWEWCRDWYVGNYEGAPTDGSSRQTAGEMKKRVLRGGSWYLNATYLRSAFRNASTPDRRDFSYGFRLVAVVRTQ